MKAVSTCPTVWLWNVSARRPCYRNSEATDSRRGSHRIDLDWAGQEVKATNTIANITSGGHSRLLRRDLISGFRRAGTSFASLGKEAGHLKLEETLTPLEKDFWRQVRLQPWYKELLKDNLHFYFHLKSIILFSRSCCWRLDVGTSLIVHTSTWLQCHAMHLARLQSDRIRYFQLGGDMHM